MSLDPVRNHRAPLGDAVQREVHTRRGINHCFVQASDRGERRRLNLRVLFQTYDQSRLDLGYRVGEYGSGVDTRGGELCPDRVEGSLFPVPETTEQLTISARVAPSNLALTWCRAGKLLTILLAQIA